eukprot:642886-Amphidinium_carterae.1
MADEREFALHGTAKSFHKLCKVVVQNRTNTIVVGQGCPASKLQDPLPVFTLCQQHTKRPDRPWLSSVKAFPEYLCLKLFPSHHQCSHCGYGWKAQARSPSMTKRLKLDLRCLPQCSCDFPLATT